MAALLHLRYLLATPRSPQPATAILGSMAEVTTARVPARVALAGNPSDGYGGAVVATCLPTFAATVTIRPEATAESTVQDSALVTATRARFGREIAPSADLSHLVIDVDTTIPRSVGLAGSSAIVTATIRAFAAHLDIDLPPSRVAAMTHAIERTDLGIAGGWQDEIMQAHEGTRLMLFGGVPRHRAITPTTTRTVPLYLAWQPTTAQASSIPHGDLASRAATATPATQTAIAHAMSQLASEARRAADAIEVGDVQALKAAMNTSFDLRASIMPIEPDHQAMIDLARNQGAAANFSGSGGAIVGVVPKHGSEFLDALRSSGLLTTTWDLGTGPEAQ